MNVQKKEVESAFIFRAIFALETGGGEAKTVASNKRQAIKIFRNSIPFFDQKIKVVELIGEC